MAKILLVEDDNNLREIYEARLQAEGYDIVSAQDGEDALVKAKQEKPDLVISDVMMPRISGFEMLDILRNTEGLKDAKVIMLTALGQAEDKTRADALGADRYLVKSQVTLEDIVHAADELLNGGQAVAPATTSGATVAPEPTSAPTPATAASDNSQPAAQQQATSTPPVQTPPAMPSPTKPAAPTSPTSTAPAPTIPVVAPPAQPTAAPVTSMPPQPVTPPQGPATDQAATAKTAVPATATPNDTQAATTPKPTAAPEANANPTSPEPTKTPVAPETAPQAPVPVDKVPDTAQPSEPTPNVQASAVGAPATAPAPQAEPEAAKAEATVGQEPAEAQEPEAAATEQPQPQTTVQPTQATPAPVATPEQTDTATTDDKLIADAVKQLTDATSPNIEAEAVTPKISAVASPAAEPSTVNMPDANAPQVPTPQPAPQVEPEAVKAEATVGQEPAKPQEPAAPDTTQPSEPTPNVQASATDPTTEPAPQATEETTPPKTGDAAVNQAIDGAQSAADEQAIMQKQIDDFIQQQDAADKETPAASDTPQPAPQEPAAPVVTATEPPQPQTTVQPTQTTPAPVETLEQTDESDADNVSIAHKKVIQPPVQQLNPQPDLNELLAKEGIHNLDEHTAASPHTGTTPFAPPHAPGHVIAPSGQQQAPSPDDPNSIAL